MTNIFRNGACALPSKNQLSQVTNFFRVLNTFLLVLYLDMVMFSSNMIKKILDNFFKSNVL